MSIKRNAVLTILFVLVILFIFLIPKTEEEMAGIYKWKPVTITYAYCYSGELETSLNDLIDEFNRTQGKKVGICVETMDYPSVNILSDIVHEKILGETDKEIGDINMVTYTMAYIGKTMNKIAALDDYLKDSVWDEYFQGYLERGRYTSDSNRGVFPLFNSTKVIYVNNVLWSDFKKAYPRYGDEVFETWEGIVEASLDYYDWTDNMTPDIEGDGAAFIMLDSVDYLFTGANQQTASLIQPGHKEIRINIDRSALRKMWDTVYRGYIYGSIALDNGNNRATLMADGKIACYIDSTDNVGKFPFAFKYLDDVMETTLKVFRYPTFKESKSVVPFDGSGLIVMKSNSRKEYACFYFLNWLVSQEKYTEICYDNMFIPVKRDSVTSEYAEEYITKSLGSKEIKKRYKALVLKEASEQILNCEAYAPVEFTKSESFKNDVKSSLCNSVNDGIAELNKLQDEGMDKKEALLLAVTEDLFDDWYKQMTNIAELY